MFARFIKKILRLVADPEPRARSIPRHFSGPVKINEILFNYLIFIEKTRQSEVAQGAQVKTD